MSGRFGRPSPRGADARYGNSYDEPDSPPSRRGPSKAEVNASLERARYQLGDSDDEDYGANPYGADSYGGSGTYTRDREDSLDQLAHVGDFNYEPTEFSPRASGRPDHSYGARESPRGYDRPSPRGYDRPSPRAQERPSPRGYDRPSPRAQERPSPRGYDRPSPRAQERPSPRGYDRPSPRAEPVHEKPSPRGYDKPSPRASPRHTADHVDFDYDDNQAYDTLPQMQAADIPLEEEEAERRFEVEDDTYMMFGVKHMQLKKDAHKLSEPHLLISVVDRKGNLVEAVQRTPDAQIDGQMLIFDYVINIDTNLATLISKGGAVFFELRQFKLRDHLNLKDVPREQGRNSVKAYSYINATEIRHMACRLPIYRSSKPTDFKRTFQPAPLSATHALFTHIDVIVGSKQDLVRNWGYISPRPPISSPSVVNFLITSLGLKDAHSRHIYEGAGYVNPRMMVTVVDKDGNKIDKSYMTGEARAKQKSLMVFDQEITIPLHVQDLYDLDAYFYFEFVHWKADKGKDSVKCYSYMSMNEMRNGKFKLPIYKSEKPTNYTRSFKQATQSIETKDLWFRIEIFCQALADLAPVGQVDYSVQQTDDGVDGYGHEDDGVAYTGADYYQGEDDTANHHGNAAFDPYDNVDPDGLVQYGDRASPRGYGRPSPRGGNVDI